MKSFEDAKAACAKAQDPFYLDAFMIEAWLGDVVLEAATEYAEKKNAKNRAMQCGQGWRGFLKVFGHAQDEEFPQVLQSLYRFTEFQDVQSLMLLKAIFPMSVEHECFGDFLGPKSIGVVTKPKEIISLMRRSVERWCEWLDSQIHFNIHEIWHLAPVMLDPDPEKRELAALGVNQRAFGHLSDFSKSWWQWHHDEASERFKDSPKWKMVGKAMAAQETKIWNYPDLDNVVILLWPLVKRHNWTYRDLKAVVSRVLPAPHPYLLEREQDLAAYCTNVLGLQKHGCPPGKSSPDGRPTGYEVAERICQREEPPLSS
jgi:hypothetical protein